MTVLRLIFLVALGAVLAPPLAQARQAPARAASNICANAAAKMERTKGVPNGLLHAIALVESGRWDKRRKASYAWPWTVTAKGGGKFYPTKRAAIRAVKALRARGVTNIDIGCMQINLRYHGKAFSSLQDGFDPARNVEVAAAFLGRLRTRKRSWTRAIQFYHSSVPARQLRYYQKVSKARQTLRNQKQRASRRQKITPLDHRAATSMAKHRSTAYARQWRRKTHRPDWKPKRYHRAAPVFAFKRKTLPRPTSFAIPSIVRTPSARASSIVRHPGR